MKQETCLAFARTVSVLKKYGSVSAFCSSKFEKSIVLASSLGGVPVLSLEIFKENYNV